MKSPQFLYFVAVALLGATIAVGELVDGGLDPVALALLTGAASLCGAIALWRGRPIEERRYVPLGSVFCLYYAVSYGFAILGAAPLFSDRLLPEGLDPVDLSALPLGILAWLAGYRLFHPAGLSTAARHLLVPRPTLRPVSPGTLLAFFATTVLVRIWQIASGSGYSYLRNSVEATTSASSLGQYMDVYGQFGVVVLGLAIVASGGPDGQGYRRAYWWMIPVELAMSLLAGSKSSILLLVLVLLFASSAAGTLRLSTRKLVLMALITVLVVFPFIGQYRDILRPGPGQQLSPAQGPAAAVEAAGRTASTFADGPRAYSQFAFDQTAGRLREVDRAAVSIQAHDAGKPYSPPGEMIQRVETGLIPRLLWPGKPINLYALEVSRDYYGLTDDQISASSLSPVGDAYRYGGLVMVAVSLALVGAFVRFLDEMLSPRESVWMVPLLIAAIPLIRGGDLVGLLLGAVRYFLIVGLCYRFLFVRARGRSGALSRGSGSSYDAPGTATGSRA